MERHRQALLQVLISYWRLQGEPAKALPQTVELIASSLEYLLADQPASQRKAFVSLLSDRMQSNL